MQPRVQISRKLIDNAIHAMWTRRMLTACALIVTLLLVVPAISRIFEDSVGEIHASAPLNPACAAWDQTARDAAISLIQDSSDAALRQIGDVVFRLRRARRNCQNDWVKLACHDYRAIVSSANVAAAVPHDFSKC